MYILILSSRLWIILKQNTERMSSKEQHANEERPRSQIVCCIYVLPYVLDIYV
jgi:hypothetical protein